MRVDKKAITKPTLKTCDRKARRSHINHPIPLVTGAQPKAGTDLKMQTVRFFNVTFLGIYRWLIEILSAILKRTRHGGQSRERL